MEHPPPTKRLKVVHVINDLLVGGAQTAVCEITSRLSRERFSPEVWYLNEYGATRKTLHEKFSLAHVPVSYIGTQGKTSFVRAVAPLYTRLRVHRPDIVHCHLIDATIAGVVAARLAGVKTVVVHEHNTQQLNSWKVRMAYALLRPFMSLTLCYAPTVEDENFGVVRILREPPIKPLHRSYTIYNGVDIERVEQTVTSRNKTNIRVALSIAEEAVVIVSVARLVPWKGQVELLDAFIALAREYENTHLMFVGEGETFRTLQEKVLSAGLSHRVHLLGARLDVYDILFASDISALPYIYTYNAGESIGISGFESMAFGLPLVASDYPSGRRIITSGENGLLVAPGDRQALVGALRTLLTNPYLRLSIGRKGRETAYQIFDWRKIVPVYEQLYILLTP